MKRYLYCASLWRVTARTLGLFPTRRKYHQFIIRFWLQVRPRISPKYKTPRGRDRRKTPQMLSSFMTRLTRTQINYCDEWTRLISGFPSCVSRDDSTDTTRDSALAEFGAAEGSYIASSGHIIGREIDSTIQSR